MGQVYKACDTRLDLPTFRSLFRNHSERLELLPNIDLLGYDGGYARRREEAFLFE